MNLLSRLRMLVDINSWRTATRLVWNVSMGSSRFYLTKCLRCIPHSFLLLTITFFMLFTLRLRWLLISDGISISVWTQLILMKIFNNLSHWYVFCSFLLFTSIISLLLSGDIKTNPGPDPGYSNSFSFCQWNLNYIAAHNFINPLMYNVSKWSKTPSNSYSIFCKTLKFVWPFWDIVR